MLNAAVSVVLQPDANLFCSDAQLESLRNQTYQGFEVVIVSEMDSVLSHNRLAFCPNLTVVKPVERSRPASLNSAVAACSGEFIAFLVGNDVWPVDKLRNQIEVMTSNPGLGLCYTDVEYSKAYVAQNQYLGAAIEHLCPIDSFEHLSLQIFRTQTTNPDLAALAIVDGECIQKSTVMMARKCIPFTGLFDTMFECLAERDMWIKILRRFDAAKIGTKVLCSPEFAEVSEGDYIFEHEEICLKYIQYGILTNNRELVDYATKMMKRSKLGFGCSDG